MTATGISECNLICLHALSILSQLISASLLITHGDIQLYKLTCFISVSLIYHPHRVIAHYDAACPALKPSLSSIITGQRQQEYISLTPIQSLTKQRRKKIYININLRLLLFRPDVSTGWGTESLFPLVLFDRRWKQQLPRLSGSKGWKLSQLTYILDVKLAARGLDSIK